MMIMMVRLGSGSENDGSSTENTQVLFETNDSFYDKDCNF